MNSLNSWIRTGEKELLRRSEKMAFKIGDSKYHAERVLLDRLFENVSQKLNKINN